MNLKEISLVKNSAYSVFYSLLNSIFPFFIYMYVARILMPDNLGQVAAAQNNKGYFTMILVYGVSAYGVKMIAQSHKDSNTLSRTFSEIALLNTVLDLFFVLVLKMKVDGVALATVLAQIISAVAILISLTLEKGPYGIRWKEITIDRAPLISILRIGLPSSIQSAITAFSNVFVQSYINAFGAACMAGYSI